MAEGNASSKRRMKWRRLEGTYGDEKVRRKYKDAKEKAEETGRG